MQSDKYKWISSFSRRIHLFSSSFNINDTPTHIDPKVESSDVKVEEIFGTKKNKSLDQVLQKSIKE